MRCLTSLASCIGAVALSLSAAEPSAGSAELPPLVEYPYVSIYYTKPTVEPGEKVKVRYYMTDWNHSRVRLDDATRRFDAMVQYGPVGGPYKTVTEKNLPSGDHEFEIGPFERGDYVWSVWVRDCQNGLESARILHDVRVRTAAELAIPEDKVYLMTEEDLKAYGIVPERDGRYRTVLVDTDNATNKLDSTNIPAVDIPEDGYVNFAPSEKGKLRFQSFKYSHTVYGRNWNADEVANVASNNNLAIQRFIDDRKAAGFRKVVLLPKRFRVAHEPTIILPTEFTLDMNGATLKLNGFKGKGCYMIKILDGYDTHLVNGTIEGDYYEHDYSVYCEWVDAVHIGGASRYSSVENMTITHITGYGATIDAEGEKVHPGCAAGKGMFSAKKCQPGAVDLRTGELDESVRGRFTSDWVDLACFSNVDRLCVSHYIDPIRGQVSRNWNMTVAFYDADRKFVSGQTAFLYRDLLIPRGARFARVTAEFVKPDNSLMLYTYRNIPAYCVFRNNRFHLNRSVAFVPFVCREVLAEKNDFGYCGEACTHCGIDTEDGWEGLHDFYFRDNVFHDTQNADMILNSGINCVIERNVGTISARPRLNSPCIRDNVGSRMSFLCGVDTSKAKKKGPYNGRMKSGYARYERNVVTENVNFGDVPCSDGWTIALNGASFAGTPEKPIKFKQGRTGVFNNCAFTNCVFWSHVRFENCSFVNCSFTYPGFTGYWKNCDIEKGTFLGTTSNVFVKCVLRDSEIRNLAFTGFVNCRLVNTSSAFQYWVKPAKILMHGCDVKGTNYLWDVGRYTIGRFDFRKCTFDLGDKAVVRVRDCRGGKADDLCDAVVSAEDCTMKSMLYDEVDKGKSPSSRPTVFGWANCRRPKGLPMGRQAAPQPGWRDLEEADWLKFKSEMLKSKSEK